MTTESTRPSAGSNSEGKTPPPARGSIPNKQSKRSSKRLGKQLHMLAVFANGKRHHRFSAEQLGDHCLPSTISDLQKIYGITFARKMISVPNRFGGETSVMLYWLEGESLEIAHRIISQLGVAA
jgi:hypothetical protein